MKVKNGIQLKQVNYREFYLVKSNSLIPHIELAQSTASYGLVKTIEWVAFSDNQQAEGKLFSCRQQINCKQ